MNEEIARTGIRGPTNVDQYLAGLSQEEQIVLESLRKTINSIVPDAVETISYRIPTIKYRGKSLVAFSAAKNHLSFHVMSPTVLKAHRADLAAYGTTDATIHFTAARPLPRSLLERLITARIEENEKK
jgi:uncharacterized protein YdhG (YjbR/CyaY superfamily)